MAVSVHDYHGEMGARSERERIAVALQFGGNHYLSSSEN